MTEKDQNRLAKIRQEIITALSHPEASDGLYFRNFQNLHEADDRPSVGGDEIEVLEALKQLIAEGVVTVDDSHKEMIFFLANGVH